MTHLKIEQNTGLTEEVNSSIISKLYELAISGDLDDTSDLKGRLHAASGSDKKIDYLTSNFNNLYITADIRTIDFEDSAWELICINTWGSGGTITKDQMQSVTYIPNNTLTGNQELLVIDLRYSIMNGNGWFGNNTNCPNVRKVIIGGESTGITLAVSFKYIMQMLGITHLDKYLYGGEKALGGRDIGSGSIDIIGVKNITIIGSYLTRGNFTIDSLYIWLTTPPTWTNGYGDDNSKILHVYVPVGCKQTYLSDTNFTSSWNMTMLELRIEEYDFSADPLKIFEELS